MAYLMTFFKAYILLLPLMYFTLMLIIVTPATYIQKKIGHKRRFQVFISSVGYALVSFGCSAFEGPKDKNGDNEIKRQPDLKMRPLSKLVYSIVLITFAIYFGFTIAPGLLSKDSASMDTPYNATLAAKYNSSNCESLCPREGFNATEIPDLESYCNNLQYYISVNTHYAMWITIAVLFVLSWIEAALEACGTFMPCHKALDVSWRHEQEEERLEDAPRKNESQEDDKSESNSSNNENQLEHRIIRDSLIDARRRRENQEDDKNESNSSNNENQLDQDTDAIALQPISESPQDDPQTV